MKTTFDIGSTSFERRVNVKLSATKTHEQLLTEQLRDDPAFRAEWERTAVARAVSVTVVRHRAEHGLSQRDLAKLLGMSQPQVARLERGDVNPSIDTLMRLAAGLGIEFMIDVRPADRKARLVNRKALSDNAVGGIETAHANVLVAAA